MATKNKLREYHIVKAKSKSSVIFTEHISDDFTTISAASPSKYVKYCWAKYGSYASTQKQNNAMNGKVFELLKLVCLEKRLHQCFCKQRLLLFQMSILM